MQVFQSFLALERVGSILMFVSGICVGQLDGNSCLFNLYCCVRQIEPYVPGSDHYCPAMHVCGLLLGPWVPSCPSEVVRLVPSRSHWTQTPRRHRQSKWSGKGAPKKQWTQISPLCFLKRCQFLLCIHLVEQHCSEKHLNLPWQPAQKLICQPWPA